MFPARIRADNTVLWDENTRDKALCCDSSIGVHIFKRNYSKDPNGKLQMVVTLVGKHKLNQTHATVPSQPDL